MAKTTYIYRITAGYSWADGPERTEFFYARNKKQLLEYVKELFKNKKYNEYNIIQLGTNKTDRSIEMITGFEKEYLEEYYATNYFAIGEVRDA